MIDPQLTNHETKQLKIGPYEILPVLTGSFGLDGGAMFGTVPKVLWEKTNPADEKNRIQMEARALLLKSKDRNILIDTGNGSDFVEKYGEKLGQQFSKMYNVAEAENDLLSSLKMHNVSANQITDVILTHLHFDHAGGATCWKQNKLVPTFPKATYHLHKQNLLTAQKPNVREKASYFPANYQPLLDSQCLKLYEEETNLIFPNIQTWISNGHTIGHQAVIIEDDRQQLIYCGDVIPTSSHIRSAWIMGYDLDPLKIIEEKRQLLQRSLKKQTFYFFEHDPYCDMATVTVDQNEFKLKEKFWLK